MNRILCLLGALSFSGIGLFNTKTAFADVSLDEAAQQVRQNRQLRVLGAKTERIDGKQVHVIRVLTPNGRVQHLRVNAETGHIQESSGQN